MDRLTKRCKNGKIAYAFLGTGECIDVVDERDIYAEKLAAYEDTGLDPEEIAGLCEMDKRSKMAKMLRWEDAEQAGRLVVLPCKVGDTVYQTDLVGHIYASRITQIIYDTDSIAFDERAIGKTVFLTREEAENALKGGAE